MPWEIIDNIRGARGPQGLPGAPGDKGDTGLRGLAGPIGPAGTIASADAESVPASENAAVIMSGSSEVKHAHFKIPRGLPGVNAVANDTATATYVATPDSETRGALDAEYARKGSQPVSAADFGLVYDGVTNVTAQILAAADAAAASSGVLVIPPGDFLADGMLLPAGVTAIHGPGARLRHTGVGTALLRVQGAITPTFASLTADAAPRAATLTLSTTATLVAGDLIVLYDGFSYTSTDASYKSGEMLRVKSVDSASQITVYGWVQGSWADTSGTYKVSNGAKIARISARKSFSVSDLSIEGTGAGNMIVAEYVDGVNISNVSIRNAGAGIGINSCRDVTIGGNSIRDLTDSIGTGVPGYGVYVQGPSANVVISGNTFARMRHSFTTIGGGYGMPHGVVVSTNTVSECTSTGIDTHAAGEAISIIGNVVSSCLQGINTRTPLTHIADNIITGTTSHGINAAEESLNRLSIVDNMIYGAASGSMGINIRNAVKGLLIQGNGVYDSGADGISINVASSKVIVKDNSVVGASAALNGRSLIKSAALGGETPSTGSWVIADNVLNAAGYPNLFRAINLSDSGVTGASVIRNTIIGTFQAGVVQATGSFVRDNVRADQAAATVSGAKGGNGALTSLIAALVAQGIIVDTTT